MAALDDLLARVADPALRADLEREIAPLRGEQELGLVFERHLPESVRLTGHPIRRGLAVTARADDGDGHLWQVGKVSNGVAHLRRQEADGSVVEESRPVDELVVVREFGEPIYPGLTSVGKVQRGGDKPWHVAINAENYHALETLLYTCEGRVDAIYIDPPYNSGARDWKYNNDYVDGNDRNRHSKWLSFMEKRLLLAKRLLNLANSVLIVTIDEKEVLRLGLLLEQVFPAAKIQMVSAQINPAASARAGAFGRVDEYIFFVHLGESVAQRLTLSRDWVSSKGRTHTGLPRWDMLRRSGGGARRQDSPGGFYPVYVDPDGPKFVKVGAPLPAGVSTPDPVEGAVAVLPLRKDGSEGRWMWNAPEFERRQAQGRVRITGSEARGFVISILKDGEYAKIVDGEFEVTGKDVDGSLTFNKSDDSTVRAVPGTQWRIPSHDATQYGSRLLRDSILPGREFPFPKSLYAVEDALRFFVADKPDALIVDFFAGSGTTAHAVARLNRQDGGRRRSISVSNNEVSPDEAKALRAAGHLPGDREWEAQGIFEHITQPRITAAVTGQTPGGDPVKGDYKFVDEFPMADGFEENVEFFRLTYEDADRVRLGAAFEAVAPLLWLRAGAEGPRIDNISTEGWTLPEGARYGVLFRPDGWPPFVAAVRASDTVRQAFIVTDSDAVFQQVTAELPDDVEPVRLYESYLTSFTINTGGAA